MKIVFNFKCCLFIFKTLLRYPAREYDVRSDSNIATSRFYAFNTFTVTDESDYRFENDCGLILRCRCCKFRTAISVANHNKRAV